MNGIFPPRGRVKEIRWLPRVDQVKSRDSIEAIREFHVILHDHYELNVNEFVTLYPEFNPGTVYQTQQIEQIEIDSTSAHNCFLITLTSVPYSEESPFLQPIDWTWESAFLEIPAYQDVKGRPIQTRAGEPITGLTRKLKLWVLRGSRKVPDIPKGIENYGYSVNKDRIKIDNRKFKPGFLSLQRLQVGAFEQEVTASRTYDYRLMTMEMWFNPLGWAEFVPHTGFYELTLDYQSPGAAVNEDRQPTISDDQKYVLIRSRCRDADNQETREKVFLNRFGQRPRNALGKVKTILDPSDIVTLRFDLEEPLPYKPLVN